MKMLHAIRYTLYAILLVFAVSGCIVRTYPVTKDRIDQNLAIGNRGYLKGQTPSGEVKERKTTRTTRIVEIELHSPIKFETMPKAKPIETKPIESIERTQDQGLWGNRGYITQSETPEIVEPTTTRLEKYTVQKGDTLQKISKKFYGTSKKWAKIYEANKDMLKGPDKIYPGQAINIPVEPKPIKEPKENLK